jgi:hypothetical protein
MPDPSSTPVHQMLDPAFTADHRMLDPVLTPALQMLNPAFTSGQILDPGFHLISTAILLLLLPTKY